MWARLEVWMFWMHLSKEMMRVTHHTQFWAACRAPRVVTDDRHQRGLPSGVQELPFHFHNTRGIAQPALVDACHVAPVCF